jgi:23S rRNA pseudouridine1911/1915/1917 synthase
MPAWAIITIPYEQIYIVHRLDKHTSGPLVFAKTPEACRFISAQFVSDKADRIYHCLVWGCPEKENGTIETFIGRIPHKPECIGVSEDGSFGKRAVTHYRVLKRFSTASLIECRLETGRTHQVRIHMLYNGTPLIGDQRYPGNPGASGEILNKASAVIRHQALHARSLSFANPGDDQRLNFSVGYPQAFLKLMDFLESL